jgi:integrase
MFGGTDMGRRRGQRSGYLREEKGSWLLTYRVYTNEHPKGHRVSIAIGPAEGPGKFTKKQAERIAYDHYLSKIDIAILRPQSTMTVGQFWSDRYEPALRKKKHATQIQYISLWRRWLEPVLKNIRLCELLPLHIERAIANAMAAGKSTATAQHIKKVASAIFTYAKRQQCASGDNPAQLTDPITVEPVRKISALTFEQAIRLIDALPEPARTMSLMSVTTSMNVSELLGLCECHVNFTDEYQVIDGSDMVPPHEISVREHLYHGRRGTLKAGKRRRNIPMAKDVEESLKRLIGANATRGPQAPVIQTTAGTKHSADNLAKRILKPVAASLDMAWVSWHVLRHTHATLTKTVGMSDYDRQRLMGHASADMLDRYTHEDRERIRNGVEDVTKRLIASRPQLRRVK